MDSLYIAIAQMKSTAGDLSGNGSKIIAYLHEAEKAHADLLILPEACLNGYPAGDIVNRPSFLKKSQDKIDEIIMATKNTKTAILFGAISKGEGASEGGREWGRVYNSLYLAEGGQLIAQQHKHLLPNEDVFHEKRNFIAGDMPEPVNFHRNNCSINLGLLVCNDMWYDEPAEHLCRNGGEGGEGADILITCNGSPFHSADNYHANKLDQRLSQAIARVAKNNVSLVFVNAEGGQDDLVFDGQSFIINEKGELAGLLPAFDNELHYARFKKQKTWGCTEAPMAKKRTEESYLYQALVVGLRDYLYKSGFKKAIIGLSGGIDSALVACLAVDALGADNVLAVRMPSKFSGAHSLDDAETLAKNLNIKCHTISIESLHDDFLQILKTYKDDSELAGENIQARLRGDILMYIANAAGDSMVLATGNKSEIAMGYATLYGDMCGGFAPIKDLYKMRVFSLCKWRNSHYENYMLGASGVVIPNSIIEKPPSAELRENQKDEDSLPPYDKLDAMLEFLIENNGDWGNMQNASFSKSEVDEIWQKLVSAEYKRAQGVVGSRVTVKAFGSGWCYPLAHKYKSEV